MLALALLISGCSKDPINMGPTVASNQIMLHVNVSGAVDTGETTYAATESGYGMENTIQTFYIKAYGLLASGSGEEMLPMNQSSFPVSDVTSSRDEVSGKTTYELPIQFPYDDERYQGIRFEVRGNYETQPAPIASEDELWNNDELKPLFFSGTSTWMNQDAKTVNIELTRQVAKLRIKVGVSSKALSDLEIDMNTLQVKVLHMSSNSAEFGSDAGVVPGAYFDREASAASGTLRPQYPDMRAGSIVDSCYLHENYRESYADENTTAVWMSMKITDPSTGRSEVKEYTYKLRTSSPSEPEMYRLTRNTIYTLNLQVVSIEDNPYIYFDVQDWSDVSANEGIHAGSISVDRNRIYMGPGIDEPVEGITVTATPETVSPTAGNIQCRARLVGMDKQTPAIAGILLYGPDDETGISTGDYLQLPLDSPIGLRFSTDENYTEASTGYLEIELYSPLGKGSLKRYIPIWQVAWSVPENVEFFYTRETKNITIDCYATFGEQEEPMSWTARFIDENGDPADADWCQFPPKGEGKNTYTAEVTTLDQYTSTPYPYNSVLQAAPPVGSSSAPYDLSTDGGTTPMTTANCYVINAPGYYQLPLVYGNAIKNGANNTSAYTSTASGTNILNPFINHLAAGITDPYIYNNANCVPADAVLVWQDWPNLVTNVSLGPDATTLRFEVPQGSIGQGNAVVAVRDADQTIMWSWHIWVTNHKLGEDDKTLTYQGEKYVIMPIDIGWCDVEHRHYMGRSINVRLMAMDGKVSKTLTLTQPEKTVPIGNQPLYQGGRKDPMLPPSVSYEAEDKKYYSDSYAFTIASGKSISSLAGGIQNPFTFYSRGFLWWWGTSSDYTDYYNLWSANNDLVSTTDKGIPVVKTIYDPSPKGYRVPEVYCFGNTVSVKPNYASAINSPQRGNYESYGFMRGLEFYCNEMSDIVVDPSGGTYYMPCVAQRDYNENSNPGIIYRDGNIRRWLASYERSVSAGFRTWTFSTTSKYPIVYPTSDWVSSGGVPIRAQREE